MYKVIWDNEALKDLKKLNKSIAINIASKVSSHLTKSPDTLGKPLKGVLKGLYRYRIGNYRIIYELRKAEVVVVIVRVGHRSGIYNK